MSYTNPKYTYVDQSKPWRQFSKDMASLAGNIKDKRDLEIKEEEEKKELELKQNEKENKELLEYGRTQNMAFNKDWWSKNQYENPNSESITQQFFKGTGKEYADLMMKIKSGDCDSDNCTDEMGQVTALEAYPQATADFIGNINAEFGKITGKNYDPNQESDYTLASKIFNGQPGFTVKDGYKVNMNRNDDGTIEMVFEGPGFKDGKLSINNNTLGSTLAAGGELVHELPSLAKLQNENLQDMGIFAAEDFTDDGELKPGVSLDEEFMITDADGNVEYETVVSADGMTQQNIIKWDENKFNNKMKIYVDTQLEGLQEDPADMIGLWNVRLGKGALSYDEDLARAALGMPDATAQEVSAAWKDSPYSDLVKGAWSYDDIPLSDEQKTLFAAHYTKNMKDTFKKRFMPQMAAPGLDGQVRYTPQGYAMLTKNKKNTKNSNNPDWDFN